MISFLRPCLCLKTAKYRLINLVKSSAFSNVSTGPQSTNRKVIMSGIQPTGIPHLGNYLGAIHEWSKLRDKPDVDHLYICIVDLHALTTNPSKDHLRKNLMDMACSLMACGMDHPKVTLFFQSSVMGHTELAWILASLCNTRLLAQLPQWREKSSLSAAHHNTALFTYPILQAADILLYQATHVPVGEDQVCHLELTRDLVNRFNSKFPPFKSSEQNSSSALDRAKTKKPVGVLVCPETMLCGNAGAERLKSLSHPEKKMSKSDPDCMSRIELSDSPELVTKKIRKAVTDSDTGPLSHNVDSRPGLSSLLDLYSAIRDQPLKDTLKVVSNLNKLQFKTLLSDAINSHLTDIRSRLEDYRNDPDRVRAVLENGRYQAQVRADETMVKVREVVGLDGLDPIQKLNQTHTTPQQSSKFKDILRNCS